MRVWMTWRTRYIHVISSVEIKNHWSIVLLNIVSHLLFGGVALSFLNFMIASVSMFNFFTKLDDMMKTNSFQMILLGWTKAILGGTHKKQVGVDLSLRDLYSYSLTVKAGWGSNPLPPHIVMRNYILMNYSTTHIYVSWIKNWNIGEIRQTCQIGFQIISG